jgi:excinuclease ABC subunit C
MVVFINGIESKKDYRRFRIKNEGIPNDFAMMQEVINRRLKHSEWEYPDLLVVDGGKSQLSAAQSALEELGIDIPAIGLAKKEETIVVAKKSSDKTNFFEIKLPISNPGVNLLRRIRDEAHRFAIAYHKKLRRKILI